MHDRNKVKCVKLSPICLLCLRLLLPVTCLLPDVCVSVFSCLWYICVPLQAVCCWVVLPKSLWSVVFYDLVLSCRAIFRMLTHLAVLLQCYLAIFPE